MSFNGFRDTTSSVIKTLEIDFNDEIKYELKEIRLRQDYIVFYYFYGTFRRAGVGHTALWDGERYYSYGDGPKALFKGLAATTQQEADMHADLDTGVYGTYRKIIILVNETFLENRSKVQAEIAAKWCPSQYDLQDFNCVHMVQDYLIRAKIQFTVLPYDLFFFPHNLADVVLQIAKKHFSHKLAIEQSLDSSPLELSNRVDFLTIFQKAFSKCLSKHSKSIILIDIMNLFKNQEINKLKAEEINLLYYRVKEKLAEKNYESVWSLNKELQDFFTEWFLLALDHDPKKLSTKLHCLEIIEAAEYSTYKMTR